MVKTSRYPRTYLTIFYLSYSFKVGTLDSLVVVGEDLSKIDQTFDTIIERLHGHLRALNTVFPDDLTSLSDISILVDGMDLEDFISTFKWDAMKYRIDYPPKQLADSLSAEISQMDGLIKSKMNAFYAAKGELDTFQKGKTGSLVIRDLSDLMATEHLDEVAGSEFMETLAVVVPRQLKSEWTSGYTLLADLVVPDSSRLITEDQDSALFTVTLFKKFKSDFIKACSAHKYTVRDLKPASVSSTSTKSPADVKAMETTLRAQWSSLFRLLRSNLADAYVSHLHLKALRLFVESVLRYGLPASYLVFYVRFTEGEKAVKGFKRKFMHALESMKLPGISLVELSTALHSLGLSSGGTVLDQEEQELWTALNISSKDFEPYVQLTLKIRSVQ